MHAEGIKYITGSITVRQKGVGEMLKDGKVVVKEGYTWHMGTGDALKAMEQKEKDEEVGVGGRGENVMDVRISQRFCEDWEVYEDKHEECLKTYQLLVQKNRKRTGLCDPYLPFKKELQEAVREKPG